MKLTKEQVLYIFNNPDSSPSPDIIKSLAELALKSFGTDEDLDNDIQILNNIYSQGWRVKKDGDV